MIFGAGASYDSAASNLPPSQRQPGIALAGGDSPYRPPLTQELFSDRGHFANALSKFQQCHPVVDRIRQATILDGVQLEAELAALQEEEKSYPRRRPQLTAIRYYLREIISQSAQAWWSECSGITNYVTLVGLLDRWSFQTLKPVNYVTFNYDTLLEWGLRSLGRKFMTLDDYIGEPQPFPPPFEERRQPKPPASVVIKPHGSVNWSEIARIPEDLMGSRANGVTPVASVIDRIDEIMPTGTLCVDPPQGLQDDETALPALALPVNDKQRFICPPSHVSELRRFLSQSELVLIIGWRAADPMLVEEMRNALRPGVPVFVANGSEEESGMAISALREGGVNQVRPSPLACGFSELLRGGHLDAMLVTASQPF